MVTQCSEKGNQHAVKGLREGDLVLGMGTTLNTLLVKEGFLIHCLTLSFNITFSLASLLPSVLICPSHVTEFQTKKGTKEQALAIHQQISEAYDQIPQAVFDSAVFLSPSATPLPSKYIPGQSASLQLHNSHLKSRHQLLKSVKTQPLNWPCCLSSPSSPL